MNKNITFFGNTDISKKSIHIDDTFFGTYKLKPNEVVSILNMAYDVGYRHFDLAELYRNQKEVGRFLKDKKREEIYLTSKISFNTIIKGKPFIIESIENTLRDLETTYIDLMLIHAPCENDVECWNILTSYKERGIIKNIGVSNYNLDRLKKFINSIENKEIYCNQIEYNIHLETKQKDLIKFCEENNIIVTAYNIFHLSENIDNKNIMLDFIRHSRVIPIIMSRNKDNMISNLEHRIYYENKEKYNNIDYTSRYSKYL